MARGGRSKARDETERRCIVTRESGPKAGLIRFVLDPGGLVVPDLAGRLPGRGLWVTAERAALERAAARGLFARAARRPVTVPEGMVAGIEVMLARRVVDGIALARKAGEAVAGLEKVKAALVAGEAVLLIQAADGSARGRAALRPPEGENTLVSCLFGHELGLAFARDNVIHAAVLAGGLADRIRDEARRLAGVRIGVSGPDTQDVAADDAAAGEGPRPERQTTT